MKRSVIGLLFGLLSLTMFGCGSDNNTPWWLYSSSGGNILLASTVGGVTTQAVTNPVPVTITATPIVSGALVPDGTEVTFALTGGTGTLSATSAKTISGKATVTLTPATGTSTITASSAGGSGQIKVAVVAAGQPASLAFTPSANIVAVKGTLVPLKVVLKDTANNPIKNQQITFTATGGTLNPATSVLTNDNGEASVTLTNTVAGIFNVTAKLDDVITTYALVTYVNAATDIVSVQSVTADPATPVKGTNSTISALIVDQTGAVRKDIKVNFTTTGGTLSAASAITDAAGKATITLTSPDNGSIVVTAKLADYPNAIGNSVQVNFITSPQDPTAITLASSAATVVKGAQFTVTATVLDGQSPPHPAVGKTVTFTPSAGDATTVTTDATGKAAQTYTAGSAGTVTYTASVPTGADPSGKITSNVVTVNVINDPLDPGTITLASSAATVASGAQFTVTATVLDAQSPPQPAANKTVTFTPSTGAITTVTTDATGKAAQTFTAGSAGSFTCTSSVPTTADPSGKITSNTVTVTVTNNPLDPATITLVSSAATVVKGATFTLTATVLDAQSPPQPVVGKTVTFTPSTGAATTVVTDATGKAAQTYTAGSAGTVTYTASVPTATSNVATVVVIDVATITLTADPATIVANGLAASTLTALVKMTDGSLPSNIPVTFATTDSHLKLSGATSTTNNGIATITVTASSTANGSGPITASVGTVSGNTTLNYTGFSVPTKVILTVFTTGTLPTGTKIGAAEPLITSPVGLVIDMDPDTAGQPLIQGIPTGSFAQGSYNTTTRVADVAAIKASGFTTGNVLSISYVIPATVAVPQKSDFVFTVKSLGDVNGATIPGLGLDFSLAYQ